MKLGIFCANGVEEVECLTTVDYCRRAGLDICMYSVHDTNEVTGAHDIPFLADRLFDADEVKSLDGLILPGGGGYVHLEAHAGLMEAVEAFAADGRLVAAICASPSILARAGLLAGKKATVYPGMEVADAGVDWSSDAAVTDGNIITGKGPAKAVDFALAVIAYCCGDGKAAEIAAEIQFA